MVFMCSSLVIETLRHQNAGKQVAVACLYCDFHAYKELHCLHVRSDPQASSKRLGTYSAENRGGVSDVQKIPGRSRA